MTHKSVLSVLFLASLAFSAVKGQGKMLSFVTTNIQREMWANAQRDGRPAEYRWHPLLNAAV